MGVDEIKMVKYGIAPVAISPLEASSGTGLRSARTSRKGAKPDGAIKVTSRGESVPDGSRIDFVFQIRSIIRIAASVSENRRFLS